MKKSTHKGLLLLTIGIIIILSIMQAISIRKAKPPVWGKGDLPDAFQKNFGNDNGARLDFVQNQVLDKHAKVIAEIAKRVLALEAVDPNE